MQESQLVYLTLSFLPNKDEILNEAQGKVDKVLQQFRRGLITEEERYDRVISYWSHAKDVIQDKLMDSLDTLKPDLHDE